MAHVWLSRCLIVFEKIGELELYILQYPGIILRWTISNQAEEPKLTKLKPIKQYITSKIWSNLNHHKTPKQPS